MRIKEMEKIELPREKLEKYGPERLTNAELLAILLRTGTEEHNVLELSKKILRKYEGQAISTATVEQLQEIHGLGIAKACEIVACFELGRRFLKDKKYSLLLTPQDVWRELEDIRASKREHFVVFYLDARNQAVKRDIVSMGTLNNSIVHPREVFEAAIQHSAAYILIAHNHPSGTPQPSDEDLHVTRRLQQAGEILGIQLVDHVIVTISEHWSFKEKGLL
jgi:DNA repair protein RadC